MNIYKKYDPEQIDILRKIAADAATECFGVVAMSSKNAVDGLITMFRKDNSYRGVKLEANDDSELIVKLYVVLEYGVRANAVAENLIEAVKYEIESVTQYKVKKIEVNVLALRA